MQMSVFPLAISSSATHGSLILATVDTGMFTCFLISSLACACGAGDVPGAGIELPLLIVFPPETWMKSTPVFSSCLDT